MPANPRVSGYLSRALSHEMSVAQQYLTQACLCELWGLPEQAAYFRREAGEEQDHAGKIIRHMLTLGFAPNATRLAAVRPGRDLREMPLLDRQLEVEAVHLYDEALRHAQRFRDPESAGLFAALLADEQSHIREIDRMLSELA
ncbi:MAG: ferritin-like domain-containing protein [Gallionellaceae bacterium]|nr:ferritin-like domain-containing protein [Gallionellaceae bacterium]